MASDAQMRDALKKAYPSETWKARVKNMSHNQVLAIYKRLVNQKVIKV